jgi:two-component system copper resistance phosphate regulon response regulator CusR
MAASVLVIEDDLRVGEILVRGLRESGYLVTQAWDGETGLRAFKSGAFDLVISDILMPHVNGLTVCKTIRSLAPDVPVMLLTALGSTDDKLDGFGSGADDYLVKPFDMRELLARVQVLLKRRQQTVYVEPVVSYGGIVMDEVQCKVSREGQDIHLTPREFALLRYFLHNPERVISRKELAEKVWDTPFDTGTNIVDVYIAYLRKKIDHPFTDKMVHTRTGMGFILTLQP